MTAPKLDDLFPPVRDRLDPLGDAIADGYVRTQDHPTLPLRIFNYTEKAAFEAAWNHVTRTCRGLVANTVTGEIVSRPFAKFMNHGQGGCAPIALDARVQVVDKMDGCFPHSTALNLWDGGTITIGEVVRKRLPVTLVGMNERGELVPALVTDWHDNGRKDHWLDIEVDAPVSRASGAPGHPNRLRVTVNHHVHVNGEYRPACEVRPGDALITQAREPSAEVIGVEQPPGHGLVVPRRATVVSVTPVEPTTRNFPDGRTGYDITTATHNYLAQGVLVHNSLGIVYPTGDGRYAVATRGSFTSDQAIHATAVLRDRYGSWEAAPDWTALFEIVYPQNRIVVNYGDVDDLVFLGAVEVATGTVAGPEVAQWMGWHGPRAEVFTAGSFAEALALEPRPNAEGVVVRCLDTGGMIKLKQTDYIALHKIVTGLTARTVWEFMLTGAPLGDLIAPLPDEFHGWVRAVADGIFALVREQENDLLRSYENTIGEVVAANPWWLDRAERTTREGRKAFASVATSARYREHSWALFSLLDGRDIRGELLKRARPEPHLTAAGRTFGEDTA